ncbi:Protein of unknown function [Massilia yuzhufengensis]|uniref:DUF1428 domain-containing protein n=1 Tax=Massilia yuzhufengensis TaxID=1164594 RepID=A0A1I1UGD5_9BURK|nr:Protein of unknown function [Massilia yuzhufengensis]
MAYVDGFLIPLPKSNIERYREVATRCGEIWREHGALQFRECIADDVKPGKFTSFPQSVNLGRWRDRDLFVDRLRIA